MNEKGKERIEERKNKGNHLDNNRKTQHQQLEEA